MTLEGIIAQRGQAAHDAGASSAPNACGLAPGACSRFTGVALTVLGPRAAVCARCGRPDFMHQGNGRDRVLRLGGLDANRMAMALAWLAGFSPSVFDIVLEATEPCADDGTVIDDGPEPYCTACRERVGIFTGHGNDWRHFRGEGTADSKAEVYDAGHPPVVGWRRARRLSAR